LKDLRVRQELLAHVFVKHADTQGVEWREEHILEHFLCKLMPSWNPEQWPKYDRVNKYGTAYLTKSFFFFTNAIVPEDEDTRAAALKLVEEDEKESKPCGGCKECPECMEAAKKAGDDGVGGRLAPGQVLANRDRISRIGWPPVDRVFPWKNVRDVSKNIRHRTHDKGCFLLEYCENNEAEPMDVCFLVIWKEVGASWLSLSAIGNSWQPHNARLMANYIWQYPPMYTRVRWSSLDHAIDQAVQHISNRLRLSKEPSMDAVRDQLAVCEDFVVWCEKALGRTDVDESVWADIGLHRNMAKQVIDAVKAGLADVDQEGKVLLAKLRHTAEEVARLYEGPRYEPPEESLTAAGATTVELPVVKIGVGKLGFPQLQAAKFRCDATGVCLTVEGKSKPSWGVHKYSRVTLVRVSVHHQQLEVEADGQRTRFFTSHIQYIANEIRIRCGGGISVLFEPGTRPFQHSMEEIRDVHPPAVGVDRSTAEQVVDARTSPFIPLLEPLDGMLVDADDGCEALAQSVASVNKAIIFLQKHHELG